MRTNDAEEHIHVMTPEPDSFLTYFRKIWQYRALIGVFARRDLKVKYAQTFIGLGWTIVQPLTALLIYTFFFGYILNWRSGDIAFPVYVLSGLLGWNFFSYIVHAGSQSVQEASNVIRKIYFPKSILPLSKVIVALVELLLSFTLLIPLLIYYDTGISWKIVFLPLLIFFNALCGLAIVFWIAAFAYKKRDLFHLLPFIIYFGIWFTPVFFTDTLLPAKLRYLLDLNPMSNVVRMWRWMLFEGQPFHWCWILNFGLVCLACVTGMYYYNRRENKFADFA